MAEDSASQSAPQGETAPPAATTETPPQTATEETKPTVIEEAPAPVQAAEPKVDTDEDRSERAKARIDQLTREKWELRRENETLRAAVQKPAGAEPVAKPITATEAQIEAKAIEIAEAREFNSASDRVYQAGKEAFADFDAAIGNFKILGGLPMPFLKAVVDIPDAHKILRHLSGNLDQAERVMSLPPARMGFELARLAADLGDKPRPVSGAPAPIKPLGGTAKAEPDLETMPIKDWVAWREKNRRQRR